MDGSAIVNFGNSLLHAASKKQKTMDQKTDTVLGTYGYDLAFMKAHNMEVVELRDENNKACLMVSPALQGRVMTSSANGTGGKSFGWINYKLINSGKVSEQFNPYGGEERFWLGPEGGPFSIIFRKGKSRFLRTGMFLRYSIPKL